MFADHPKWQKRFNWHQRFFSVQLCLIAALVLCMISPMTALFDINDRIRLIERFFGADRTILAHL